MSSPEALLLVPTSDCKYHAFFAWQSGHNLTVSPQTMHVTSLDELKCHRVSMKRHRKIDLKWRDEMRISPSLLATFCHLLGGFPTSCMSLF